MFHPLENCQGELMELDHLALMSTIIGTFRQKAKLCAFLTELYQVYGLCVSYKHLKVS